MDLKHLGFSSWHRDTYREIPTDSFEIARITAVDRERYLIRTGSAEIRGELAGKLRYTAGSPVDFPTVGDWVLIQSFPEERFGLIMRILPRRTVLMRKKSGKDIEHQLIGANIDTALIVQSVDANFSLRRLERYLVIVREGGIHPVFLLSKTDLFKPEHTDACLTAVRQVQPDLQVIHFSNETGEGVEAIEKIIKPGETLCLLGSSGVGKTTLLNRLIGNGDLFVQEVRSGDGKGRHTTTRRQLIPLKNGGLVIDTPGMRELGHFQTESGLSRVFDEIQNLAGQCKFDDCSHTHETGCAVRRAVEEGTLDRGRYENFLKMQRESAHYSMSYREKRKKDKEFGKMVKQVMKYRKNTKEIPDK
jgi:ribosome biogenesis GTPase